jgi:hypothetical protein
MFKDGCGASSSFHPSIYHQYATGPHTASVVTIYNVAAVDGQNNVAYEKAAREKGKEA